MFYSQGEELGRKRTPGLLDTLKRYATAAHAQTLHEQCELKNYVTIKKSTGVLPKCTLAPL